MTIPQGEAVDWLMVGDPVPQPVHAGNRDRYVSPPPRQQARERTLKARPPERGLIPLVQKKPPETEVQLGDHLAGYLDLAVVGESLTGLENVGVAALVEQLRWVVVPLSMPAFGGMAGCELLVKAVAQNHLEVAENLKQCSGSGSVPSVKLECLLEVATNFPAIRAQALDAEPPFEECEQRVGGV